MSILRKSFLGSLICSIAWTSFMGCGPRADHSKVPGQDGANANEVLQADQDEKRVYPAPPPPTAPRAVNFPNLQKFTLENNGLTVYVVEDHSVPLVDIDLVVKVGDIDDPVLASMTADMLQEGTKKLSKAIINEAIAEIGSSINTGAGTHNSFVDTRVMSKDLKTGLFLLDTMVEQPKFAEDALAKVKDQAKVSLLQMKSNGSFLASSLFAKVVYPEGHPYGQRLPTASQIDAVTTANLKAFHQTYYVANNSHLLLSGDVTLDEAKKLVSKYFKGWRHAGQAELPPNPLQKFGGADFQKALPTKLAVHMIDRPQASAEIVMGNLAMTRTDPNWINMEVVNRVLGSSSSSRLFSDMREQRKLTYGVYSKIKQAQSVGTFAIKTQTAKVDEMLKGLFQHVDKIRSKDPDEKEFSNAVNGIVQSFPLQIETASQVAGKVNTMLTFGLPDNYFQTYRDQLLKVKRNGIHEVAKKYIHAVPVIVIVGELKKVEKQLANVEELKSAKLFRYDTDLNPIK